MDLTVLDIENSFDCLERHMLRHAATRIDQGHRGCSGAVRQMAARESGSRRFGWMLLLFRPVWTRWPTTGRMPSVAVLYHISIPI
jgi:hypothetical protein